MKKILVVSFCLLAVLAISCSTTTLKDREPYESFIFGYMDMDEAPSKMQWLQLKQVSPRTRKPYLTASHDGKGLFWFYNIKPGSYRLAGFGGQRGCLASLFLGSADYRYAFPEYGENGVLLRVKRPGIYYIGSYKYKKVKTGFFEGGKFGIDRTRKPDRRELLKKIIQYSKNSNWHSELLRLAGK